MSLLRQKSAEGGRAALAAFNLPAQPGLGSVGIKPPTSAPGFPPAPKTPGAPSVSNILKPPAGSTPSVKSAVSAEWVERMVQRAAPKTTPQRLDAFAQRMMDKADVAYRESHGFASKRLL